MNFETVKKFLRKDNQPDYRVAQVRQAVFGRGVSYWAEATALPEPLRQKLEELFPVLSFKPLQVLPSKKGDAFKAVLQLKDGFKIETVLMRPMRGHWSVCVSTQVGCAIGCAICATGKMKFARNLSAEEISDQALFWHQYVKRKNPEDRIAGVVFMGMGEPLLNYAAVVKAVGDISDPDYLGIGQRHISISTSGHAGNIQALAGDLPQVNLAVSLHSVEDEERDRLVPMNKKYPLDELKNAVEKYISRTGRQVFLEYAVIPGVNNLPKHTRMLGKWVREIKNCYLIHVNLIPYNNPEGKGRPDEEAARTFAAALTGMGMSATVRKSLGSDIKGACGQLAAGHSVRPRPAKPNR